MAWMPGAIHKPIAKHNKRRRGTVNRLNLHIAVSEASSLYGFFSGAAVCSHFYVRRDGTIEQYIDSAFYSAADLEGNDATISAETQGGVTNADREEWTPQQLASLANIFRWVRQTHGVANNDFLRVVGADGEGTKLPAGPVLVAAQLPDSNPTKQPGLDYIKVYEAKHGEGSTSTFGAHMWDAGLLLQAALPEALKSGAKPGTVEFRQALRNALENVKDVAGTQGVFNMTPGDHAGLDERARVMVQIKDGKWVYLK